MDFFKKWRFAKKPGRFLSYFNKEFARIRHQEAPAPCPLPGGRGCPGAGPAICGTISRPRRLKMGRTSGWLPGRSGIRGAGPPQKLPKGREKHRFPIGKRCFCGRGGGMDRQPGDTGCPADLSIRWPAAHFVFSEHEIAEGPEAGRLRSGRSRGVRIRSGEGPGRRRREGRPYQRIRSQRAREPPIRTARSAAPRTVSRNEERDVHPLAPRRP